MIESIMLNENQCKEEKIAVLCLSIPLIFKYVLPSGIVQRLSFILGISFFLPYFSFFLYYFKYGTRENNTIICLRLLYLQLFFCILSWILGDYNDGTHIASLYNFIYYYIAIIIGLTFTLTDYQKHIMSNIFAGLLLFSCIQVIVLSTGFVVLESYADEDAQVYGSVARSATTLGDTNNGGIALFLQAVIAIYLNRSRKILFVVLILAWVIASMLLVTKSVALALVSIIAGVMFFYIKDGKASVNQKIKTVILVILTIFMMYKAGVFNPIIERVVEQYLIEDLSSGREDLQEVVLSKIDENSILLGHGPGTVYANQELSTKSAFRKSKYSGAPHNSYILQYAETGAIGVGLFILFWVSVLWHYRKADKFLLLALLCYCGIFFNTETVSLAYIENQIALGIFLMLLKSSANYGNKKSIVY